MAAPSHGSEPEMVAEMMAELVTVKIIVDDSTLVARPPTLYCDLNETVSELKSRVEELLPFPAPTERQRLIFRGKRFADETPLRVALAPIDGTEFAVHLSLVPLPPGSANETPVNETPVHQTPVHQTPVHQTPVHQTPVHQTPVHQTPVHQTPVHQTPVHQTPVHETPVTPVNRPRGRRSSLLESTRSLRDFLANRLHRQRRGSATSERREEPPHPDPWGHETLQEYLERIEGSNEDLSLLPPLPPPDTDEAMDLSTFDAMWNGAVAGVTDPHPPIYVPHNAFAEMRRRVWYENAIRTVDEILNCMEMSAGRYQRETQYSLTLIHDTLFIMDEHIDPGLANALQQRMAGIHARVAAFDNTHQEALAGYQGRIARFPNYLAGQRSAENSSPDAQTQLSFLNAAGTDHIETPEGVVANRVTPQMWLATSRTGESFVIIEGNLEVLEAAPGVMPAAAGQQGETPEQARPQEENADPNVAAPAANPQGEIPGQARPQEGNAAPAANPQGENPGQDQPHEGNADPNAPPAAANGAMGPAGDFVNRFIQAMFLVWMMTSSDSWWRPIAMFLAAVVALAETSGFRQRIQEAVVASVHRHMGEFLARYEAQADRPNTMGGWLLGLYRAVTLLLASIFPGIGEHQVQAARELAERQREEQEAVEEEGEGQGAQEQGAQEQEAEE